MLARQLPAGSLAGSYSAIWWPSSSGSTNGVEGTLAGNGVPMRFLKPVELAKMCMLNEVLLWVSFRRLPVAIRSAEEGREVREAERDMAANYGYTGYAGYAGDLSDWELFLEDGECAAVGLPPDPRMAALREEKVRPATGRMRMRSRMRTRLSWTKKTGSLTGITIRP